ncbi:MAG: sodium:solute symporter family transporter, partial [Planctomycetota bacterium]
INVVLGLLFLLVGTALFAFYNQAGQSGLPAAGAELTREDQILPYFVATELSGVGLAGLILAGLFAAAMSTIDSGINGVTSVIVYDWLKGRMLSIRVSRAITAVLGVAVIAAALVVPVLGDTIIGIITAIASISLGMLLAIFLLGMFVRRANMGGMLVGLAAGFSCLGYVWKFTSIPKWWFGAFTIFPTFVVGLIASFLFPPPGGKALKDTLLRSG